VDNQQRRHDDQHTFENRGEVLSLVVTVGMGDVGRFLGIADGNEGSRRGNHIDDRFKRVGVERD
jgi:hypothetical protein